MSLGDFFKKAIPVVAGALTGGVGTAVAAGLTGLAAAKADSNSSKAALERAQQQRDQSLKFINDQVAKTQGQLFNLFPQIQDANNQAANASLNVLKESFPAQQQAFVGGNMAAQEALLAGLPQMNASILGGSVNPSVMKARAVPMTNTQALSNPQSIQFAPMVPPELLAASKG
jgi:hypothetical protein